MAVFVGIGKDMLSVWYEGDGVVKLRWKCSRDAEMQSCAAEDMPLIKYFAAVYAHHI